MHPVGGLFYIQSVRNQFDTVQNIILLLLTMIRSKVKQ